MSGTGAGDLARELARRGLDLGPVIGRGATTLVYRAFDSRHDRSIAVKVLPDAAADPAAQARWAREISIVAQLRHPNIVPLLDSGTTPGGTAYFLMPLAVGETLQARLTDGPLPIPEAIRSAREVAEALAYAHSEGLVHGDVKPGNILLEGEHAVLADFGLARAPRPEVLRPDNSDGSGLVVGTPAYMSPEQLTADAAVDGRSDQFGLGVVLYEMLTGRLPFEAQAMPALLAQRVSGQYPPLAERRAGVPPLVLRVIARALAPDPRDRYDRTEAMVADLRRAERELDAGASDTPPPAGGWRWGLAGALLMGLLAVGGLLWHRRSARLRFDPDRVVVADMRNETGDSTLAPIGPLASDLISAGVSRVPGLTVINSDLAFSAARRAQDRRLAWTPGAGLQALLGTTHAATVVSGSYYAAAGGLVVFAEVIDAASGRVLLDLGPLPGTPTHPEEVLMAARDSVTAFLRQRRSPS